MKNDSKKIFVLLVAGLALTGFAQMPIFKRYYIADLPGLGWLAQFYTTNILHTLLAALLIAWLVYLFVDRQVINTRRRALPSLGMAGNAALLGLVATGLLITIKNLDQIFIHPDLIIVLDLLHTGCCLVLLVSITVSALFRSRKV